MPEVRFVAKGIGEMMWPGDARVAGVI